MSRKNLSAVIAIIILVGIYLYEFHLKNEEQNAIFNQAEILKENTKYFFLPTSTTDQIVHHNYYSLSYNESHEQSEWVAYELKKSHLSNTNHKRPYFEVDRAIKTKAAHWRNYKNSGYDRGHLCPAGDRRFSKDAHDETFLTSNISPQKHDFNSGIWNRLEQKVRYWAGKYDGVFVVSGGILEEGLSTIGSEEVSIPNHFYKILLDYNSGAPKVIAFLIPHRESKKPLYEFVVAIDDIELLTGIDFFPELPDDIEEKLESSKSYKGWSF